MPAGPTANRLLPHPSAGLEERLEVAEDLAPPAAGAETVWGGYSGLFIDPDGHPWEVANNPRWTVHEDGTLTLG